MHRRWLVQLVRRANVDGVGDDGGAEVITLWIERKPGALWAVGRAVGLAERHDGAVHPDDYVFEGYEMEDAVDAANEALDVRPRGVPRRGSRPGRRGVHDAPSSCPSSSAGSSAARRAPMLGLAEDPQRRPVVGQHARLAAGALERAQRSLALGCRGRTCCR